MSTVRVAIAGSTGSIGTQTIDVIRADLDRFRVVGLSVGSSVDAVVAQARALQPEVVAVADPSARRLVAEALANMPGVAVVDDATAICDADVVINGVVGFAGLPITMATLAGGHRLGLANKESLIAAGPVVQPLRATPGAELIPVDSEHCALHQCLRSSGTPDRETARLVLTASGGPFRGRSASDLASVTVDDALAHPTWSMGPKITVDSATLANKGLELIEAHFLFGIPYERIEVVVHPTSVVHSLVRFRDGAALAHLGYPDMRVPISYALTHPTRAGTPVPSLDFSAGLTLEFEPPDDERFPLLRLAREAGERGGTYPCAFNAANEVAVAAFLERRIGFLDIAPLVEGALGGVSGAPAGDLAELVEADEEARRLASGRLVAT